MQYFSFLTASTGHLWEWEFSLHGHFHRPPPKLSCGNNFQALPSWTQWSSDERSHSSLSVLPASYLWQHFYKHHFTWSVIQQGQVFTECTNPSCYSHLSSCRTLPTLGPISSVVHTLFCPDPLLIWTICYTTEPWGFTIHVASDPYFNMIHQDSPEKKQRENCRRTNKEGYPTEKNTAFILKLQ